MKLNDFRGEKALEIIMDLIDPASRIMADPVIVAMARDKDTNKLSLAKTIVKGHKAEVLEIMALLDGVDAGDKDAYSEYLESLTPIGIIQRVLEFTNDPEIVDLFTSQGQTAK